MGCGASKQAKIDRLADLEQRVKEKPWTFMGRVTDLRLLESIVAEQLTCCHNDFKNGGESELRRVMHVCWQLKIEMEGAMDEKLLKGGDVLMVQKMEAIAVLLDGVIHVGAAAALSQKKRDIQEKVGQQHLRAAKQLLDQWPSRDTAEDQVKLAGRVGGKLQEAHLFVLEVPSRLESDFMLQATALAMQMENSVTGVLQNYPPGLLAMDKTASSLDRMCLRLQSGASWQSLHQKLQEVKIRQGEVEIPRLLDEVEQELGSTGACLDLPKAFKLLEGIVAMSSDAMVETTLERLDRCFDDFQAKITPMFDAAISEGDDTRMDVLIELAEDAERLRAAVRSGQSPSTRKSGATNASGVSLAMKTKKAKLGVGALLNGCRTLVAQSQPKLHALFEVADRKARKEKKEKLAEPAEPPSWFFKLAAGGFKPYNAEKSAEVEKYYQEWLRKGQMADQKYHVQVEIEARRKKAGTAEKKRERCKYGAACFRKNPDHLQQFSHPQDPDWDDLGGTPVPDPPTTNEVCSPRQSTSSSTTSMPGAAASSLKVETYILDFSLMTQAATSKKNALRNINRKEGATYGQTITKDYFQEFDEFVNKIKSSFEKIEYDLGLLEEVERDKTAKELLSVVESLRDPLVDFFNLAALVGETKRRDDTVARLGAYADKIGVDTLLIESKLTEALEELQSAYAVLKSRAGRTARAEPASSGFAGFAWPSTPTSTGSRWPLLRMLRKEGLIKARLAVVAKKRELQTHARRRAQMAILSVMRDAGDNEAFKEKASSGVMDVLTQVVKINADVGDFEIVKEALKLGRSVDPQKAKPLLAIARQMADRMVAGSLASKQPLARTLEVVDLCEDLAKASSSTLADLCDLSSHIGAIVRKVESVVTGELAKKALTGSVDQQALNGLIAPIAKLKVKLRASSVGAESRFQTEMWVPLQSVYKGLDQSIIPIFIEWVVAYCEQCKVDLPSWMMTKNQHEAKIKLEEALESGDQKKLRESAVFAKQANYKSDPSLESLYEECIRKLKALKRLPSGWEVDDLLGEEGEAKMFKKMDFGTEVERRMFQKLFDDTNLGILTRDRGARDKSGLGAKMPRAFQVTSVQMVMNAESWDSYSQRLDQVLKDCRRFPGAAPITRERWGEMSGELIPARSSAQILQAAHQPACNSEANEFLLLHGTKPEAAASIAENHFDMAFACKTGMFGAGLYFGESSSKCDEYAQPREDGVYAMILCRVILGRINYCAEKDPTTNPGRKALEQSCTPAGGYHSVLGDRKKARGTYREFIVYDHYQVYPLFIVWYKRSF